MPITLAKAIMRAKIGAAIIKGSSWGMYCDKSELAKEAQWMRNVERDVGPKEMEIREMFGNGGASQIASE